MIDASHAQTALDRFVERARSLDLGVYGVRVDDGQDVALEERFRSDDRVNLYSVSKTFTALALAMAAHEGSLDLDEPFLRWFPELRSVAGRGTDGVTSRHLLTMTSGTPHQWFATEPVESLDLLREVVTTDLAHEPGTHFQYTGSTPYVAARVLARATGATLRDYLMPRLFDPLKIHNPAWHTCPLGFPFAESDLFLRTEELARFGRLLLARGRWDGAQLVPEACVDALAASWVQPGYGLGVWREPRPGAYRMDGKYGQYVIVAPEPGVVVTTTAHSERDDVLLTELRRLIDEL